MKKSHTLRILLALLVIFGAFAYIVYGLFKSIYDDIVFLRIVP